MFQVFTPAAAKRPSGRGAAVVMDQDWNVLSGWSSSLRAAARKIERLAGNG